MSAAAMSAMSLQAREQDASSMLAEVAEAAAASESASESPDIDDGKPLDHLGNEDSEGDSDSNRSDNNGGGIKSSTLPSSHKQKNGALLNNNGDDAGGGPAVELLRTTVGDGVGVLGAL